MFITLLKPKPRADSVRDASNFLKRFMKGLPESDLGKLVKSVTALD